MCVRLDFTVAGNGLPAIITVRSMRGRLILYRRVSRSINSLCFCTCERNLVITVRPFNADLYEKSFFVKLGCRPCVYLSLDFNFQERLEESLQRFCLLDENYLFPIRQAELFFTRESERKI